MELHEILHHLEHCLLHPLKETLLMTPVLFLAYLLMEWLEHNEGSKLTGLLNRSRRVGPLLGGLLGMIPQCGFSGAIAGMFAAGTVTTGTLIAVILSTSDEMLPVMLPEVIGGKLSAFNLIFILAYKLAIGILVGFVVDLVLRKRHKEQEEHIHEFCEQENCSCSDGVFKSALKHTVKVLLIIYVVSVALHLLVEFIPEAALNDILNFPVLSQLAAALLGLIPSCAVSVTLTELYTEGALQMGPLLCGLLTNGGVGLLVLYRVNRSFKSNFFITLTIFLTGLIFGSVAGLFF